MENFSSPDPQNNGSIDTESLPVPAARHVEAFCPHCGQKGKAVPGQTVRALLAVSLKMVENRLYFFCRTEHCPVVYFSANGKSSFTTDQLRERVYQKETGDSEIKVCYCFDHKVGEILSGSPAERSLIIEDINAGIAAGQCACDLRNPQGSCCLGNVLKLAT